VNPLDTDWSDLDDIVLLLRKVEAATIVGHNYQVGSIYCPQCGDSRRVAVRCAASPFVGNVASGVVAANLARDGGKALVPSLYVLQCLQCPTTFSVLVHRGPDGPAVAVLPSCRGGVAMKNTPPAVAYYLDQAHRSHTAGANTAAVGMYRSALENLLFERGYEDGMLDAKIKALVKDIEQKRAKPWAQRLNSAFLDVIKKLGNVAMHPNKGDLTRQDALDASLVRSVQATFTKLLDTVYESEAREEALLAELRAAADGAPRKSERSKPEKPSQPAAQTPPPLGRSR
jgi:hypothetical protein